MSAAPARAAPAEIDRTLAALADPHRRRVVDLLSQGPRAAGDLARELALSPPAMSRHLRTLRQSGLVAESHPTFDARVRIYALRPEPMANLLRWLEEAERLWSEQLAAFKAHLERPTRPEPDPRSEPDE
jgi:DNA-binding transcriptional ArsR family regulator